MAKFAAEQLRDHAMARINDQGFDVERLERVAEGIRSDVENGRCHGVAMIVARGGKIVLDVTEGYADKAAGRRLGKNAVFVSMSVAKQFTNVMALSLVERGALRLHAPVAELIPAFGALGKEKVNLYHLLTPHQRSAVGDPGGSARGADEHREVGRLRLRPTPRVVAG